MLEKKREENQKKKYKSAWERERESNIGRDKWKKEDNENTHFPPLLAVWRIFM